MANNNIKSIIVNQIIEQTCKTLNDLIVHNKLIYMENPNPKNEAQLCATFAYCDEIFQYIQQIPKESLVHEMNLTSLTSRVDKLENDELKIFSQASIEKYHLYNNINATTEEVKANKI